MAAAISTVTKTASVVKTTKGSEKKWSEILAMNRRHDLQLPMNIAKYDHDLKRSFNIYQRQKYHTERTWANKHETWYHDDFSFRDQFLQQLKPITRRFKNIGSLSSINNRDHVKQQQEQNPIFNNDEMDLLSSTIITTPDIKEKPTKALPPVKYNKRRSTIRHFQNYSTDDITQSTGVLSKVLCPKMLNEYEPRLYSHAHASFLDVAQRFLNRQPENIEKGGDNKNRQKQQKQYVKVLIDNEKERTKVAAAKFRQQLEEDKMNEISLNTVDDDKDSFYTKPF